MQFTVKQARVHAGLTQDKMAERLEISRSTYIKLENDVAQITIGQLGRISEATGISVSDFVLPINFTNIK